MLRGPSPAGWCGRGEHGVGPASGPGAGGGTGGPGPGSPTRAPCHSEPGEMQWGTGDAGKPVTVPRGNSNVLGLALVAGLPPAFHGHGFHRSRRVLARSARPAVPTWPHLPRCRVWHGGRILPLLTASQGRLEGGCLQRGRGCHDALSRWARGWLGHRPAGTTGFAQSTLSGGAASPQGSVSSLGVLPQPCLSPPRQGGAHSLSWVYLLLWCSSHSLGELPSLSRWQSLGRGVPTQDTLWGPGPLCFTPWDRGAGGH